MRSAVVIALVLLLSLLACALPSLPGGPVGGSAPTEETATWVIPTPPPRPPLYMCYTCGGDEMWILGDGEATRRTLPFSVGQFYGYAAATDRILYAQEFGSHGAGPGNVSVSDLAVYDVSGGPTTVLLEDNVVEALWAPNGMDLAYILATPTTYELHWRAQDGSDRILASNVTFTWSISPGGDRVAFTRESGYEIPIVPGLYVVDVETAIETRVSAVDKSGTGGIDDAPSWSPNGEFVLLSHWAGPDEPGLILAHADGSGETALSLDPSLSENWWYTTMIPRLLWHPDGEHLLGVPEVSRESMGGPFPLVSFRLDLQAGQLTDGKLIADVGGLIGWDVPGRSVWVMSMEGKPQRLELP